VAIASVPVKELIVLTITYDNLAIPPHNITIQ